MKDREDKNNINFPSLVIPVAALPDGSAAIFFGQACRRKNGKGAGQNNMIIQWQSNRVYVKLEIPFAIDRKLQKVAV